MDARAGFLGEDQLAWVAEAVEESRRTWKVGAGVYLDRRRFTDAGAVQQ